MLSMAGRLCAIAACAALGSCGRVGVEPLSDELIDREPDADDDIDPDDEFDGALSSDAETEAASTDGGVDASDVPMPDASEDAGAFDAGAEDAAPDHDAEADASGPACAGARALDLCWYLSAPNTSCEQTCGSRGGYDPRTASTVGTTGQGGSLPNCIAVLAALGHTGPVTPAYRFDGRGLGCHVWENDGWWIETTPDFSPTALGSGALMACACME